MDSLQQGIESLIQQAHAEFIAVAFHDLLTKQKVFLHADEPFHPASAFKVAVMMEVFRQAAQGRFSLEDEIPVANSFPSLADGSPFSLETQDDDDPSLYKKIGSAVRVRELVRRMIVRSSNLATNLLMQKTGAASINAFLRELHVEGVQILRGVEDMKAFRLGMNNSATARGLAQIMQAIAERKVVSPEASDEMIELLLQQEFNDGIPARLSQSVKVAHKTGAIAGIYHDFGIVFPEARKPYILAVMTRGFENESEAHECVAEISSAIYRLLL